MIEATARFHSANTDLRFRAAVPQVFIRAPLLLAAAGFFLFGLALTANSQITSGGTWTLYAMLMEQGARPYSDLHLPQQPLFFLYNRFWYAFAGQSWIVSQVSAAVILALFCNGYFRLARFVPWPAWQKAVVFLTASMSAIGWEYYSFFDYRAFTDAFALYAVLVLLRLSDDPTKEKVSLREPMVLGCLCGLSFVTRANDGVMLFIAVAMILFRWFPRQILRNAALLLTAALATSAAIVWATGEPFATYFEYTLHSAPAMKGGPAQVAISPFLLIADMVVYLFDARAIAWSLTFLLAAAAPAIVIYSFVKRDPAISRPKLLVLAATIPLFEVYLLILHEVVPNTMLPWFQLLLVALSIYAVLGVAGLSRLTDRRNLLMLIPGGALLAAGMSSGGDHLGLFGPTGLLIVLLSITFGDRIHAYNRAIVLALFTLFAATIFIGKVQTPMLWQHYRAKPMFVDRELVTQPHKGPMLVEREMNAFFSAICRRIEADGIGKGLLSLPYSYANYHCGIAPWHSYVQTYFDTTSADTIDGLMQALTRDPPRWIVYQRQLDRVSATEVAFNHGRPIRHRALDTLIWSRVQRHEWSVMEHWSDEPGNDWYFIRTSDP